MVACPIKENTTKITGLHTSLPAACHFKDWFTHYDVRTSINNTGPNRSLLYEKSLLINNYSFLWLYLPREVGATQEHSKLRSIVFKTIGVLGLILISLKLKYHFLML